jgi:hypothetical protein
VGERVFFSADAHLAGNELWAMPLSALGIELRHSYLPLVTR